jgi:4'-phosphopantetheinyl transferase
VSQWMTAPTENSLQDNDVHIWLFHLNVGQPRIKHFYPLLSSEEKERSERLIDYKHRKRLIAAHGFMREALASYLSYSAGELQFEKAERGKPQLILRPGDAQIQFNLSHSENIALLAVRRTHALGIDVEYTKRKNDWVNIIKRFFTADEQKMFSQLTDEDRRQAFYQVWTRKEAHMKVTGKGLHLSPTQFTVSVPPEPARFIEYIADHAEETWFMGDIVMPAVFEDYCGCYSTDVKPDKVSYFIFN